MRQDVGKFVAENQSDGILHFRGRRAHRVLAEQLRDHRGVEVGADLDDGVPIEAANPAIVVVEAHQWLSKRIPFRAVASETNSTTAVSPATTALVDAQPRAVGEHLA